MAKHAIEQKKSGEKDRLVAYEEIKPLWKPTLAEVREHLHAVEPCKYCLMGTPRKLNADGKCLFCNGANVIPDRDRRWRAVLFVGDRQAPPPKSVEMKIDDSREREELLKQYSDKPPEVIDALLENLNINVK